MTYEEAQIKVQQGELMHENDFVYQVNKAALAIKNREKRKDHFTTKTPNNLTLDTSGYRYVALPPGPIDWEAHAREWFKTPVPNTKPIIRPMEF